MTDSRTHMAGKVCLLTGATSGIGKATAMGLAGMGATLAMIARDPAKGADTANEIRETTGNEDVHVLVGDLASLLSVRRVAETFQQQFDRLDVLINNAGGMNAYRKVTEDGYEATLVTNHLAPFLLTQLLLEPLKASAPARIVNVASDEMEKARLDVDDLMSERRYSGMGVYGKAKLALVLTSLELARRLNGTGVTVNVLHPGTVGTNFGHQDPGFFKFLVTLARPFLLTPEKGARTTLHVATSPAVEGLTGRYFYACQERAIPAHAGNEHDARRLWDISMELVGLKAETTT